MREANPTTLPWRAQVTWYAIQAMSGLDKLTGPVEIWADFKMRRPKSHYTRAGVLKLSAPVWCETRPDADKLARAVGDALTGVVFRDDCQVAKWTIRKRYGDAPGVRVEVSVLERYSR
jgi:Holliday junction resolvase RusA-like endonuclease